jgi:hypothetical protein
MPIREPKEFDYPILCEPDKLKAKGKTNSAVVAFSVAGRLTPALVARTPAALP